MARRAPSLDPMALAAIMRNEPAATLLLRLATRLWMLVGAYGWAHGPLALSLLAVCTLKDLWLWHRLRTHRPPAAAPRLVLDLLDVAAWAALGWAAYPPIAAVLILVPQVVLLAATRWWAGVGLAVVAEATCAAARLARGLDPFVPVCSAFLAVALLLGRVVVAIVAREVERHEQAVETERQAAVAAAQLAGRNAVVTGVGATAIDQLQVTIFALGGAGVDDALDLRRTVSRHKQQLGEATRAGAYYLRDALDVYSQASRASEPTASRFVFFDVPPSCATLVLSRAQARRLWGHVAGSGRTGVVPVRSASLGPGGEVAVDLGGDRVVLPPAEGQALTLPVLPAGLALMAGYLLVLAVPSYSGETLSPLVATVGAAVLGVAMVLAGLVLRRWGGRAEPWVALAGGIPVVAGAVLWHQGVGPHGPEDVVLLLLVSAWALMLGLVVRPGWARAATRLALLLGLALTVTTTTAPPTFALPELVWPLTAYLLAQAVSRNLACTVEETVAASAARVARATGSAHRDAALRELDYLAEVVDEGRLMVERADQGELRDAVAEDLERVRAALSGTTEALS